jgi:ADP-heptose:LPS heptosyltransferase
LGDVAMTVPVVREFLNQNPNVKITYVSRKKFEPLFDGIQNLAFFSADLNQKHKGVFGLYQLYNELKSKNFDAIADLHNVLRTKILRIYFKSEISKTAVLDKARKERKDLLNKKTRKQLWPMTERYADVFRNLGFDLELSHELKVSETEKENAIGIAPFAMYEGKMYPLEKMKKVAKSIAEKGIKIYLFGGKEEANVLETWENLNPNIHSVAGKFDLKQELDLIKKLKLMVSMDSANMHLASLAGTKVISIWGNTHPFMGFLGYGQSMDDVVQDETMKERPTSVFGKENKKMPKPDYFKNIPEKLIIEKIEKYIK